MPPTRQPNSRTSVVHPEPTGNQLPETFSRLQSRSPACGSRGDQLANALAYFRAIAIRQIVAAHRAVNPRVFGSVLRGQDTDTSDLDLLVDPTQDTTLFDIAAIRHELLNRLGVAVDVVTPNALPESFRAAVLAEAVAV